jgi:hypothetical protein
MRFARRVDNNASEIVQALRDAGAVVEVIHEPVDLRVWAFPNSERWAYMEVKNLGTAYGRKGLNSKQLEDMRGQPYVMVTDVQGALGALRVLRS